MCGRGVSSIGRASDSSPEGRVFESLTPQIFCFLACRVCVTGHTVVFCCSVPLCVAAEKSLAKARCSSRSSTLYEDGKTLVCMCLNHVFDEQKTLRKIVLFFQ